VVVETVGDEMRVTIDGKPAGYLKSSGIAQPRRVGERTVARQSTVDAKRAD
jgi:hypothetical protein